MTTIVKQRKEVRKNSRNPLDMAGAAAPCLALLLVEVNVELVVRNGVNLIRARFYALSQADPRWSIDALALGTSSEVNASKRKTGRTPRFFIPSVPRNDNKGLTCTGIFGPKII
jgi:hypothetical protein